VENNPKTPAIEITQKCNLPLSSLSCMMKKKQSIVDVEVKCRGEANKSNCVYKIQNIYVIMKKLVYDWICVETVHFKTTGIRKSYNAVRK
jgi:hypothetical protein